MKRIAILLLASFVTASFSVPPNLSGLKINCIKAKKDKVIKENKDKKVKNWPPTSP